jgi:hypothetical protein
MTISNGCFALLLAIGSDLNLYLIGSEIVRDDYVFDFTLLDILRHSDTHCSTLIGFIGMVRGSNPSLASTAVFVSGGGTTIT